MNSATIAAISTPDAAGGISVVRISGSGALAVAEKIFRPHSPDKSPATMKGFTCCYGKVFSSEGDIDDGILTVYHAPKSYTGEDVAEISCHGGVFVTRQVLRCALENGAVLATAGEFTQRAFLNGKLSLTQAEAVMDIITARSAAAVRSAEALRDGALYRRIHAVSDALCVLLGEISAWTDYPEEDIEAVSPEHVTAVLNNAKATLSAVLDGYDNGRIIREGVDTVIVGKPNVGKSTIMNCLAGCDRSIVTDIAGTTRDIIEETIRIDDFLLRLSDTAGIRETEDEIEFAGVERSFRKLEQAQLVLAVFDNSERLSDDDFNIISRLSPENTIAVINKSDKDAVLERWTIDEKFTYIAEISAIDGSGIERLKDCIAGIFRTATLNLTDGVIANERQRECAERAVKSLDEAISAEKSGISLDAVGIVIDEAVGALMELTGERVSDAVVAQVFSKFCVGK